MNLGLLVILLVGCGALMLFERRGLKTTLALTMKGDIKRESRWLAQYGQAVCTAVAVLLVWQLDVGRGEAGVVPLEVACAGAWGLLQRDQAMWHRVRPRRGRTKACVYGS